MIMRLITRDKQVHKHNPTVKRTAHKKIKSC